MLDKIFLYPLCYVNTEMCYRVYLISRLQSSNRITLKRVLDLDNWFYLLDPSLVPSASHCLFP